MSWNTHGAIVCIILWLIAGFIENSEGSYSFWTICFGLGGIVYYMYCSKKQKEQDK